MTNRDTRSLIFWSLVALVCLGFLFRFDLIVYELLKMRVALVGADGW